MAQCDLYCSNRFIKRVTPRATSAVQRPRRDYRCENCGRFWTVQDRIEGRIEYMMIFCDGKFVGWSKKGDLGVNRMKGKR